MPPKVGPTTVPSLYLRVNMTSFVFRELTESLELPYHFSTTPRALCVSYRSVFRKGFCTTIAKTSAYSCAKKPLSLSLLSNSSTPKHHKSGENYALRVSFIHPVANTNSAKRRYNSPSERIPDPLDQFVWDVSQRCFPTNSGTKFGTRITLNRGRGDTHTIQNRVYVSHKRGFLLLCYFLHYGLA